MRLTKDTTYFVEINAAAVFFLFLNFILNPRFVLTVLIGCGLQSTVSYHLFLIAEAVTHGDQVEVVFDTSFIVVAVYIVMRAYYLASQSFFEKYGDCNLPATYQIHLPILLGTIIGCVSMAFLNPFELPNRASTFAESIIIIFPLAAALLARIHNAFNLPPTPQTA